jgi:hypothetical protein
VLLVDAHLVDERADHPSPILVVDSLPEWIEIGKHAFDPLEIAACFLESTEPLLHVIHPLFPFGEMKADLVEPTLEQGLRRERGFGEGIDQP